MARRMNPPLQIPRAWYGGLAIAAAVALAALGSAASAQSESQPTGYTGSVGPEASPAVPRPWSGQSGASGHPQMTAEAIRAAAADFPNCLAGLWPLAAKRGITRPTFESATTGLEPDLRIMDLLDAQPEFNKAVWDYLDILVTDARIARGQEILAAHRGAFDAAEKTYGVDRHVVAAIWGVESNYGTAVGERPVVRSTATLACVGRRQAYFREELLATLEILERGDVSPAHLKGSWAGAFGPTQFMPTAFKRYAVDFDGDGRRDVVDSVPDVIGSTANNLRQDGWVPGETWGYEVAVPQGFDYMLADRSRLMTVREWQALGLKRANGRAFPRPADRAFLLLPAGARGPGFLMLNNFRVIMKYNPAEAYALAIGYLADRLRGDPPLVQAWPRDERVLSVDERYELQERLNGRGFAVGEADGRFGPRTRAAIRDFQARAGMLPDGFPSAELLERLRGP